MLTILFSVLKKVWWLVPIVLLAIALWWQRGVEGRLREKIALDERTISLYAGKIDLQNQQVLALQAAGQQVVAAAQKVKVIREQGAERVVVRWKTRLVPVNVPTDCSGAVAAGATNAAQIGQLFMGNGK